MDLVLICFRRKRTGDAIGDIQESVTHLPADTEFPIGNGGPFDEFAGPFPQLEFRRVRLTLLVYL
jgi:hypothetical protein